MHRDYLHHIAFVNIIFLINMDSINESADEYRKKKVPKKCVYCAKT